LHTEKVEGTLQNFLCFAVIPHGAPVHVCVRTRAASLARSRFRNLYLSKAHIYTKKNKELNHAMSERAVPQESLAIGFQVTSAMYLIYYHLK